MNSHFLVLEAMIGACFGAPGKAGHIEFASTFFTVGLVIS